MIDPDAIQRDAQANIADWPVTIRHLGVEIQAALNTTSDISQLLEGGLLDNPDATVLAIREDFTALPQCRDIVELKLADDSWMPWEVKRVPDLYDPLLPHIQFTIGTPDA
jgi:hypothetical protein